MDFLTNVDLAQQLGQAIRSGGEGGLTTAQNLRDFLTLVLDELRAEAEASRTAATGTSGKADLGPDGHVVPAQLPSYDQTFVHLSGDETIQGQKTFTGDVLFGNGQDSNGLKMKRLNGNGYQRLLDGTNVGRPDSINFGAVGEGGDLRYHGATHRWIAPPGSPQYMQLDEQANLTVAGHVQATQFIGDGSQLTGLPSGTAAADNLGNHTATQALNLNGNPLVSTDGTVRLRGQLTQTAGRVGFGTDTPRAALDVRTTAVDTTTSVGAAVISGVDGYGQSLVLQPPVANYSGQLCMSYKGDGPFGPAIATGVKFENNAPTHFCILDPGGANLLTLTLAGKLGLGTETPTERVEVVGNVKATAFIGDGSQLTNLPTGPRCRATLSGDLQLMGSPDFVKISFPTATGTGYDPATGRFAPGRAGLYGFGASAEFISTDYKGEFYLSLFINGQRYVDIQQSQVGSSKVLGGGAGYVEAELSATDYAELYLVHDNGNQNYQLLGASFRTYFTARWLSN